MKENRNFLLIALGAFLLAPTPSVPGDEPGRGKNTEPTNAEEAAEQEAAARKAAAEAKIDAAYAALVAEMTPEERAWEKVLQAELGGFYLPLHKKQKVAGKSNAWDFIEDDPALPRVLLIGDSVSRGYTQAVRKELEGEANVHRAPANCGPTARGLEKLDLWLGDGEWDLIHFNFGIHDRRTPPADYERRLGEIVDRLQATGATVLWASTTPMPADWKEGPEMAEAVVERNAIAARVMEERGVATNDLFSSVSPRLAELQIPADCHFNSRGYAFLGQRVAEAIRGAVEK